MALFYDTLLTELQSRRESLNGSFLVGLLVRDEHHVRSFRESIEHWYDHVAVEGRDAFRRKLHSTKNEDFFQGFAELVVHELCLEQDLEIKQYPESAAQPFFLVYSRAEDRFVSISVASFIRDAEDNPQHARRAFKNFIDELNKIRHRHRFAVYLRRWLPTEFDPTVVRKALENWFNRLDNDPHGGQYAEYRDGGVHVEFSILGQLERPTDHLVGFNLTPLETQDIMGRFREEITRRSLLHRQLGEKRPLVVVLFNNDEWQIAINYLYDFFYGKPRFSFNWQTHAGRREIVRDFSSIYAQAIFNTAHGEDLAAVMLAEKVWKDNALAIKLRCLQNPWCLRALPHDFFANHTTLKALSGTSPEEIVVHWTEAEKLLVRLA